MVPERVIKRPIILSEKATRLRTRHNKYVFEVDREATKGDVRRAVETLFKVSVTAVHTLNVRGRMRRMGRGHAKTQNWKKAIVTLAPGEKISVFEGS
ncbi:MAG: 50S ribosomal protein L23 [Myxococcota bacterium]|nr:50S ribosomal protein L23 [Myxococcota bacterium]MDW8363247.1 50S ribosomal protein L23 [Myxococcales bacterium]